MNATTFELYSNEAVEVDFDRVRLEDQARGLKYGSYIADIEESIAAGDWRQVAEDVAEMRSYHERVVAARIELNSL